MSQQLSRLLLGLFVGTLALHPENSRAAPADTIRPHQTLQLENRFTTAEETLRYFLDRDSEGFYWSGFLEQERQEFTTWKQGIAHDSFYLATSYTLRPLPQESSPARQVFEVQYVLDSVLDSAGTRSAPMEKIRAVHFELHKDGSRWKVAVPDSRSYVPVLLQDKVSSTFPPK